MATILNEIGYFQFDNLIRNQIPFVLLNLGVDLKGFYKLSHHQNHLEKLSVNTTPDQALQLLKNRNHPTHEAILIICEKGAQAPALVDALESAGYSNVFYVKGGIEALNTDASR